MSTSPPGLPAVRRALAAARARVAAVRARAAAGHAQAAEVVLPWARRLPARLREMPARLQRLPRRTQVTGLAVLGAAVVSGVVLVAAAAGSTTSPHWVARMAGDRPATADPSPTPTPPGESESRYVPPQGRAAPLKPSPTPPPTRAEESSPPDEFVTWAIMDLHTGEITGSDTLAETSTTASMIKAWLVADYLRQHEEPGEEWLEKFSFIVRDSNNVYAQQLFEALGEEESIHRLIDICGLTDSHAVPGYWSNTALSGRDTARMGACLADGRAAGPEWTQWLLDEMRQVRGLGDFGIRHAFPSDQRSGIAIKNGWVIRGDVNEYHVNCLAIGDGWSMGVLTRYPAQFGYFYGANICQNLAAGHLLAA